jgi:hypothetical protein
MSRRPSKASRAYFTSPVEDLVEVLLDVRAGQRRPPRITG